LKDKAPPHLLEEATRDAITFKVPRVVLKDYSKESTQYMSVSGAETLSLLLKLKAKKP
jgi:hypothetical protein